MLFITLNIHLWDFNKFNAMIILAYRRHIYIIIIFFFFIIVTTVTYNTKKTPLQTIYDRFNILVRNTIILIFVQV